jgi:uncharacterized glyoxalase superfamily protein PhnB
VANEVVMQKATPVFVVEAIEPCLDFWVKKLGFEVTIQVPHGDRLGFVALQSGPVEVMYQTLASVAADTGAKTPLSRTSLFCEVADLEPVIEAVKGCEVVVPRRRAPYGADEIYVREPAGNVIGFAAFPKA